MTPISRAPRAVLPAALLLLAGVASAHTGHDAAASADFFVGLAHPFSGLDHMLAMVAVGLWAAAALPAGRRWSAPALFVGAMTLGALLAASGLTLAGGSLELLIAASVVAFGALLVFASRVVPAAGLALTAAAALAHGAAHGLEMAAGAAFVAYAAGFVLATALLHLAGLGAGAWMARARASMVRHAGALIGLAGIALFVGRV